MKNTIPPNLRTSCGIYAIYNTRNDKQYIGSAVNLQSRFYTHRSTLAANAHANPHLQHSYNKHTSDAFEFRLLDTCDISQVKETEQKWIDLHFGNMCYNINPTVSPASLNDRHSQIIELVSPDGTIVEFVGDQRNIANQLHSLISSPPLPTTCHTSLNLVLSGKKLHFRGWRLPINVDVNWQATTPVNYHTKTYHVQLLSPDGTVHGPITNLAKFCRDHNISNESTIHNLIAGRTRYVNGWSIVGSTIHTKNSKEYNIQLVDPTGVIHTLVANLTQFAKDHGLEKSGLQHLVWGKLQSHRGWKKLF